jgi:hypothetical protein
VTFKFTEKEVIDKVAERDITPAPAPVTEDVTIELPEAEYKRLFVYVYQDYPHSKTGELIKEEVPGIIKEITVNGTAVTLSLDTAKLNGNKVYAKIKTENHDIIGEIEP